MRACPPPGIGGWGDKMAFGGCGNPTLGHPFSSPLPPRRGPPRRLGARVGPSADSATALQRPPHGAHQSAAELRLRPVRDALGGGLFRYCVRVGYVTCTVCPALHGLCSRPRMREWGGCVPRGPLTRRAVHGRARVSLSGLGQRRGGGKWGTSCGRSARDDHHSAPPRMRR